MILAIEQAIAANEARSNTDLRTAGAAQTDARQVQVDWVIALAEHGCFSNRHISMLTGMRPGNITQYTRKQDATGGRLTAASLRPILALLKGGDNFHAAVQAGASAGMVARFTGVSVSTVNRKAKRVEK